MRVATDVALTPAGHRSRGCSLRIGARLVDVARHRSNFRQLELIADFLWRRALGAARHRLACLKDAASGAMLVQIAAMREAFADVGNGANRVQEMRSLSIAIYVGGVFSLKREVCELRGVARAL